MDVSAVSSAYGGNTMQGLFGLSRPGGGARLASKKFSDIDTDGDGSISQAELEATLGQTTAANDSSSTDSRAAKFFSKLDSDGDGKISSSEWSSFQQNIQQLHGHGHHHHLSGKQLSDVDTDGDGSISKSEFQSLFGQSGPAATTAGNDSTTNLFDKLDTDKDGTISATEWDAFQKSIGQNGGMDGSGNDTPPQGLLNFVTKLYQNADANGDGMLSKDETTSWLQQAANSSSMSLMA